MPHYWIAIVSAGLAAVLFVFVGVRVGLSMWRDYEKRYVEGAATTLDAMYITMPAQNVMYLSLLSFVLTAMVMGYLSANPGVGLGFGVPAFFLPRVILHILKKKRDELFNIQLVDALMNISNSLRAGFSLPQALELIHQEMPNPISQEMRLVCQELRLGLPMDEAFDNLYRRMPLADVDLLITAISIVRDVGGNLTEVFDNIAATIRDRQRMEGKIMALTSQGRAQAVVICCVPVFIGGGFYMVAPQLMEPLIGTALGYVLMGVILLLMTLGGLWIRKIVNIDV